VASQSSVEAIHSSTEASHNSHREASHSSTGAIHSSTEASHNSHREAKLISIASRHPSKNFLFAAADQPEPIDDNHNVEAIIQMVYDLPGSSITVSSDPNHTQEMSTIISLVYANTSEHEVATSTAPNTVTTIATVKDLKEIFETSTDTDDELMEILEELYSSLVLENSTIGTAASSTFSGQSSSSSAVVTEHTSPSSTLVAPVKVQESTTIKSTNGTSTTPSLHNLSLVSEGKAPGTPVAVKVDELSDATAPSIGILAPKKETTAASATEANRTTGEFPETVATGDISTKALPTAKNSRLSEIQVFEEELPASLLPPGFHSQPPQPSFRAAQDGLRLLESLNIVEDKLDSSLLPPGYVLETEDRLQLQHASKTKLSQLKAKYAKNLPRPLDDYETPLSSTAGKKHTGKDYVSVTDPIPNVRDRIWMPVQLATLQLATLQLGTLQLATLQLATITSRHHYISPPLHLATITSRHHYISPPLHLATITFRHHYISPVLYTL
jgi:hypothetical protein